MIRSHFARGVSEHSDIAKRQFPEDGVKRVPFLHRYSQSVRDFGITSIVYV